VSEGLITGGCQCGAVRYALAEKPGTEFCHCRMCQRATGGVFAALTAVPKQSFAWTGGQPSFFASSTVAERGFCAACGTPLSFAYLGGPRMNVTVGSLDDPELAGPNEGHFAAESRLSWVPVCDGAPEARLDALEGSPVRQPGYRSFQASPGEQT
jgi:hypothetical protein